MIQIMVVLTLQIIKKSWCYSSNGYKPFFKTLVTLYICILIWVPKHRHEIAGEVTEVGSKVRNFKVGDKVGVGCMVLSCRSCQSCEDNLENYCPKMIVTYSGKYVDGTTTYGGYLLMLLLLSSVLGSLCIALWDTMDLTSLVWILVWLVLVDLVTWLSSLPKLLELMSQWLAHLLTKRRKPLRT